MIKLRTTQIGVGLALALSLSLAACTDSPPKQPAPTPAPSATPTYSSFTGLTIEAAKPVLAVKIDNTRAAHPQAGLSQADVVYLEEVEAGLTRLLGIFSSRLPRTVGPVRSARESDLELLRQYGEPALAYSGAHSKLLPIIRRAPLYDVSPDKATGAYRRDSSRPRPYNLFADPARLLAKALKASPARDIGFRFGEAPAGGIAQESVTVRYPAARATFTWSSKDKRWLLSMDGRRVMAAEGGQLGGTTVVIQYVNVRSSRFGDFLGNRTPYIQTVGSGTALVLRDGQQHQARWSRSNASSGTTFTTTDGKPITFATGQVWVALARKPG